MVLGLLFNVATISFVRSRVVVYSNFAIGTTVQLNVYKGTGMHRIIVTTKRMIITTKRVIVTTKRMIVTT